MRNLIIRNFGPIKEADVELKRVTLLIGPQSSGKSTLLKVACFCDWMERQIEITQAPEEYCNSSTLLQHLISFHKLEGYLQEDSYLSYENDALSFAYENGQYHFSWKPGSKRWNYKRTKIAYIPAERNLVAAIPNWYQVTMGNNNIFDFMKEWEFARKTFTKEEPISGLPFSYKYNASTKADKIVMDGGKELELTNASSGLQALTPLFLMLKYLTGPYFTENRSSVEDTFMRDNLEQIVRKECAARAAEERKEIVENLMIPHHTNLYLEEPEAHLYPSTQKAFVYSLVELLNGNSKRKHSCVIATHSPYIMTAFNNLILAGETAAESAEKAQNVKRRFPEKRMIRYDEVAAFSMQDGTAVPITDDEYMLISADSLDGASLEIADDFNFLLEA